MNEKYRSQIIAAANAAGISNPEWLSNVIEFESGFSPTIKNPYSSARGLIQFMDSTAKYMGYAGSADLIAKHPTVESQLQGPVVQYFKMTRKKGFPTEQSVYMGVFYPKYMTAGLSKAFSYSVQKVNPGIKIVADYVSKVRRKAGKAPISVAEIQQDDLKDAEKKKKLSLIGLGIILIGVVVTVKYLSRHR